VFFYFYKIKWGEGKPPPHTPPFEKFLFKKENDNVCESKGGCPVNEIASENPMKRIETSNLLYRVVLTMEMNGMNERGYKIKGPPLKCITLLFQWGPLK